MLTSPSSLFAGTFNSDFNSGIPAGLNLYGNAAEYDHSTGGVNDSGVLKLTEASGSQGGSAIIDDFDNGEVIGGFDVTFDLYMGSGNGADGFSFFFGDFADGSHGEEGPGTINGLTISFDSYNNGGTVAEAPAIDVKWNNVVVAHRRVAAASTTTGAQPIGSATTVRTQPTQGGAAVFWPVKVHVDTDGTLDLVYNNVVIFTNMPIFRPLTEGAVNGPAVRFGFGARTGGSFDAHFVDNLRITTVPVDANSGQPFITSIAPVTVGANSSSVAGILVELQDATYQVNTNTIQLLYNNTAVTPTITREGGVTRVGYRGTSGTLPSGVGTVTIRYSSTSTPATAFDYSYTFGIDPFVALPASYAIGNVDRTKPGFKVRVNQIDTFRAPGDRNLTVNAERQLAGGYIDPATGEPYANMADLSLAGTDGYFIDEDVINWNYAAPAQIGNFRDTSTPPREDEIIPGLPGSGINPTQEAVVEILTFLELKAGGYRFGVNSDDGFRASFGPGWDAAGTPVVGTFNGGRGSADTAFDVVIPQDGIYPFRLSYWQGGGDANIEFFIYDPASGQRVLVNDLEDPRSPRAFRESPASRPSISRVLPVQNWIGASPDDDVVIDITDGAIALNSDSVSLKINGANQTVSKSKSGKVTTVTRDSSIDNLLPSGLNTIELVYGFTENNQAVTVTNSYTFTVAPYLRPIPVANKVAAGQIDTAQTGFSARYHHMDRSRNGSQGDGGRITGGGDANRMPFPEIQLNGGNINPTNGLPYENIALEGPSGTMTAEFEVINFNVPTLLDPSVVTGATGLIQAGAPAWPLLGATQDEVMPGLPGGGTSPAAPASPTATTQASGTENYVMEAITYLELKRGVHVFGFNSDDGYVISSAPNPKDTLGTLLAFYNGGRGNNANVILPVGQNPPQIIPGTSSGSTPFSVIVPEDGIYPFRILYWQGGGGVNAEFISLNKDNGTVLLVNDVANGGVPAYRGYTGPEKPWTKFSVSPTPWDNRQQQAGPGPLTMIGRTRNAANSSDIYNMADTVRPWADVGIGGIIANGAGDASIRLLLDGVEVPATKTTTGSDVKVSYRPNPPLASNSVHTASLVYAGTTNSWTFTVQPYVTLNAADRAAGAADTSAAGFSFKIAQAAAGRPGGNTAAAAEAQLAGTPANIALPGPQPDGSYVIPGIVNLNVNVNNTGASAVQVGNFQQNTYGDGWPFPDYADEAVPGLPGTGLSGNARFENFTAEIFAYLQFPTAGYYRMGANADDGVVVKIGTPGVANGQVIFTQDRGAGAADIPFSFMVPEPGLYPVRLLWYQGGGGGQVEFFSYDAEGNKIAVNDPNNANSIKAFYRVQQGEPTPELKVTLTGSVLTITWTGGGTLESSSSVVGGWASTGNATGTYTENLTAASGAKYFRVRR